MLLGLVAAIAFIGAGVGAYAVTRRDDGRRVAASQPSTSTTTTIPLTTTTLRDPRRGNGQPVTFAFGGDTHFEAALRQKLATDPSTVLASLAPTLAVADITVVNLESALTEGGAAVPKEWNFRAPATALDALRAGGIDVATEANNHGLDYGPQGLADSLAARAAKQFPVIGIGSNATEAYAPYLTEIRGQRIAIFGATDVMGEENVASWTATDAQGGLASTKYDAQARMIAAIQATRPQVDTLVVVMHRGVERMGCATPRQEELARALVDAGADIVVGSHSHVLEGGGRLGTAFVDYGLGNFIWFNESEENGRTGVLTVTATGRDIDAYQWLPARIRAGVPTPLPPGPDADAELAHWNDLRACTDLTP
jgi:poly-gamma-glutamate capsule biosynthesis protein CapA/YwtB (metallophosphatase superfamily)